MGSAPTSMAEGHANRPPAPDTGLRRGVAGTSLVGLWGRPHLRLDEALARIGIGAADIAALHDEVCIAYASLPVEYTGGSHRSMGIMPPSRTAEAVVDYVEVLRGLSPAQWRTFVDLADDPADFVDVDRDDVGEERGTPLSRRQMLWLKVRHGVYFPWKGYLELIPNRRWGDKANPEGKRFTRNARTFLPRTCALVERLPFVAVGRCNVMGLEAHDHGTVHRDGDPTEQQAPDEFITLYPAPGKRLFVWDEVARTAHPIEGAHAVWFNDFDYHGVDAAPFFRYSIRVDGVFTDAFRTSLQEQFA
jgi:hypothetical protein